MFDTLTHRVGAGASDARVLAGLGSIATVVALAAAGLSPTTAVHATLAAILRAIGA